MHQDVKQLLISDIKEAVLKQYQINLVSESPTIEFVVDNVCDYIQLSLVETKNELETEFKGILDVTELVANTFRELLLSNNVNCFYFFFCLFFCQIFCYTIPTKGDVSVVIHRWKASSNQITESSNKKNKNHSSNQIDQNPEKANRLKAIFSLMFKLQDLSNLYKTVVPK